MTTLTLHKLPEGFIVTSDKEIKERNKQIALMLGGYKCSEISEQYELPKFMTFPPKGKSNLCHTAKVCLLEDMQFHSDWNWLMEAVEFIENKGYDVFINGLYFRITDSGMTDFEIESGNVLIKKEAVFIAISDFAKLYNDKKL